MIKFSLGDQSIFCFGITEENVKRMEKGDPLYVLKESLNMPMDFQMTRGKASTASAEGRSCFVMDISDQTLDRLREGGVIHIERNDYWPVEATFIFYGKGDKEVREAAENVAKELTRKTFEELTSRKIEDFYPVPKTKEVYAERQPDGSMKTGVRPAHEKTRAIFRNGGAPS